ncbi:MAG: delta-60 repeat domain-containing protein [Desulfuromonadaceae bacterium]
MIANGVGTLDTGFNPIITANSTSASIASIAIQPDGMILIGGNFISVDGTARYYMARLNVDGTLDPAFDPNVERTVTSIAVQTDGRILIGGGFTTVSAVARNYIARLTNNDAALQELNVPSSSTVTWMRGQASPEVWRVTFERSAELWGRGDVDRDCCQLDSSLVGQLQHNRRDARRGYLQYHLCGVPPEGYRNLQRQSCNGKDRRGYIGLLHH